MSRRNKNKVPTRIYYMQKCFDMLFAMFQLCQVSLKDNVFVWFGVLEWGSKQRSRKNPPMHTLGSLDAQHVAPGVIFRSPFVVPVWSKNPENVVLDCVPKPLEYQGGPRWSQCGSKLQKWLKMVPQIIVFCKFVCPSAQAFRSWIRVLQNIWIQAKCCWKRQEPNKKHNWGIAREL